MRIVEYAPEHFEAVRRLGERQGATALCHRPFVDHYYATADHCRLHLAMEDDGTVAAALGVERMPFEFESRPLTLGFGTNFHSLQPGAGAYLYMQWMRRCDAGIAFGGSNDFHRMIARQKWTYFDGVNTYLLNPRYDANTAEAAWRAAAKGLAQRLSRRVDLGRSAAQIARESGAAIHVQEETDYSEEMLPRRSPFAFRFSPSVDYLRWRYGTRLSFVRYRAFRLLVSGDTVGYVILNDAPKKLVVAQCDGGDPMLVAHGVLLSLIEAAREDHRPREALITASHPAMRGVYERFGFVTRRRWDRPLALGPTRGVELPSNTSNWLVNFEWGDNGLRAPFRDQI